MLKFIKCIDVNGDTGYRSNSCAPAWSNIEINVKTGGSTDLDEQESQRNLKQEKQQATLEQQKQANINREAIEEIAKISFLSKKT